MPFSISHTALVYLVIQSLEWKNQLATENIWVKSKEQKLLTGQSYKGEEKGIFHFGRQAGTTVRNTILSENLKLITSLSTPFIMILMTPRPQPTKGLR